MGNHGDPPADDERPVTPKHRKPAGPSPESPAPPGEGDHREADE
jgi:hypothetical protein